MRINRTHDPVLKNRVIFTGELQPRRWLIIISVVVMTVSLATLAYFYLPLYSKPTTVVETSPINPPTSETSNSVVVHIPPVKIDSNNNQINSELPKPIVVPPVTSVEIQPSTTAKPLPAVPEQPATPPLDLNPTPSATLATPVDSSAELASLSPPEGTILPSPPAKSAENIADEAAVSVENKVDEAVVTDSATVTTSEPSTPTVESPVISAPAATQSTQIASLLAKAKSQIKRTRLTSPQGDNAYETYQILHQIAPSEADSILDNIIAWYYEQGQKYLQRGRLTSSKNNAYQMYQKIKAIAPQHPSTTLLLQGIIDQLQQQFNKQFRRQQFLTPIGNNAYTTYQDLMTVVTNHQAIQPLQNKIVKQLLREAQRQLTEEKYTTPKNDNAVDTYQKILAIAPQHVAAQQGIQKVVQEYYQRALRQQGEQPYRSSLLWINRGLKIAPDDPQLQQLKQEIEDNLSP
jgi:tetratricopeptide (TPR) repeat protein